MNDFENKLISKINHFAGGDLAKITASLQILVLEKGQKKALVNLGQPAHYFDLASLTKIIFTTSSFIYLESNMGIDLANQPVSAILPDWPHKKVKIKNYLSHSASMPAWRPFYREVRKSRVKNISEFLFNKLARIRLEQKQSYTYSDLDYWLCGLLLEEISQKNLVDFFEAMPLIKGTTLHFNDGNKPKFDKHLYAPTEKCAWRKKTLQGEVHDDNCWSFGGVAGHAGLFGTLKDLGVWASRLREVSLGKNKYGLKSSILHKYVKGEASNPAFSFGFMKPKNPLGGHRGVFSAGSVGHTGFTGTSFWWDIKRDVQIVILSNRVYPSRRNRKFVGLRKDIHDIIISEIKKPSL